MTMPDLPAVFCPPRNKISNRKFIERLQQWGWVVQKVSGEETHLMHLNTYDRIKVRSAHTHQGNSPATFAKVLEIMDMSWEDFMCTDVDMYVQKIVEMDRQEADRVRQMAQMLRHMQDPDAEPPPREFVEWQHEQALIDHEKWTRRQERKAREAEKKRAKENRITMPHSDEVVDLTAAEKEAFDQATADLQIDPPQPSSGGRIIDAVFEFLTDSGEPMTTAKIASGCKVKPSQATGALLALVQYGIAERVKSGVYRVAPQMAQGQTIHHNVTQPVPVTVAEPVMTPQGVLLDPQTGATVTPRSTAPLDPPMPVVAAVTILDSEEQIVNDVLDLMFPKGMRIRAADISLLEDWKNLTVTVMRRVGG